MNEFIRTCLEMVLQASPIIAVMAVLGYIGKTQKKRQEEREEEKKKGVIRTKYIVKTEKVLIIIFIIGAILFSSATIICTIQKEDLVVICGFGIFALVGLIGTLNTLMWKLEVNGDEITWRSTFGRKRTFRFEDITYCEEKDSGAVRVYVDGKKLFTIDSNIDMEEFMKDVERRGISIRLYYAKYIAYQEFFGHDLYNEIDYKSTEYEKTVGEEIVKQMEEVFEYVGDENNANMEVGALERYYWFPFHKKAALCDYEIDLITTKLEKNRGHVWLEYIANRYDESDELIRLGGSIVLLYIEKKDGKWEVTDIEEPA